MGGTELSESEESKFQPEPTQILLGARLEAGACRESNRDRLFGLLYDELHSMAQRAMRSERPSHTLTPTALLHELYLRLVDQTRIDWTDRARFFEIAARAMRQILIDHARAHRAAKRGGGWKRVTLEPDVLDHQANTFDLVAMGDAFDALSRKDERAASVAEMRIFAGLTIEEIAHVLGVSPRTVDTDWAFARRWLSREIGKG
ncbi:MAG TPA: sigma-70 family RNA polymerase sigma factor [Acidobacteriota bacterium]|nr:sigma-70 family RNA polymerase sigma factor [Acidobacteriota bacterium]